MSNQPVDPNLAENLEEIAEMANQAGAEGVWIIRGAKNASLLYDPPGPPRTPNIPGVKVKNVLNIETGKRDGIQLDLADAGVIVVMRFPASTNQEPGVDHR